MVVSVGFGRQVIGTACVAILLAGCAATPMGPMVQVMPGPGKSFPEFQSDQYACKIFAGDQVKGQADAANQRAVGGAILTTVLSAGLGAAVGGAFGNAGAGAAIGGATGAATGGAYGANASQVAQFSIQQQYDNAYGQCMYAKGEQVAGFAPLVAEPPPPPPVAAPVAVADPMVRATQSELIRLGYLNDTADGFMGPKTHAAIAAWQQANGLAANGSPSPRLLATLQATPTSTAAAPAPASWVAPAGSVTPAAAPAAAPAGWVAPARAP